MRMSPVSEARALTEAVLMDAVARRYYLHGESKVEIAAALGISRFKVARLLDTAISSGAVRIEIAGPPGVDPEASDRLRSHLGLRYAVVVPAVNSDSGIRDLLGAASAGLLMEILGPDDVLGLPWSRSVNDMVGHLTALPAIPVVQLCGAVIVPGEDGSSTDVVRRAARIAGGAGHVFYAPLILEDADSAAALRRDSAVSDALDRVPTVTVAVMGVGAWAPGASTICDAVTKRTRDSVAATGVVGEIGGVLFDAAGKPVAADFSDRLIAITGKELQAIPHVIAVAHGPAKVPAIAAAARGGLVDSLVTTADTAEALLAV